MKQMAILAVFLVLVSASACVLEGLQHQDATPTPFATNGMQEPTSLTSTPGILANATQQAPVRPTEIPSALPLSRETEAPLTGSSVADVIKPPDGCSLPCWLGVIPGVSTVGDMHEALLRIVKNPVSLDADMASYEASIALPGTTPQIEGLASWNVDIVDGDTIRDITLFLRNFTNRGADEVKELDRFLGSPDYVGLSRGNQAQYIWLDFREDSALIVFRSDYHGDVCLPKEPADHVEVLLYDPNARTKALAASDFDTIDWARQLGISTAELWVRLQDPTQCIPVEY